MLISFSNSALQNIFKKYHKVSSSLVPDQSYREQTKVATSQSRVTAGAILYKLKLQKDDKQLVFKTYYRLMQVEVIAECSKRSILQYFRLSLSYHLSSRSLFCLFLIGRLRQVLLYKFLLQFTYILAINSMTC